MLDSNTFFFIEHVVGLNTSRAVNQNAPTFNGKQNSLAPRETRT